MNNKVYRLTNIKVSIDDRIDLKIKIAKKLNVEISDILEYTLKTKAIDARNKNNIQYVYSVNFLISDDKKLDLSNPNLQEVEIDLELKELQERKIEGYDGIRPIVVGTGPAGMFASLMLAKWGLKPIILERGKCVEERVEDVYTFFNSKGDIEKLNEESNVQFGEGGAGTFSDGKLTTNTHNKRIQIVLEELLKAGAKESIKYDSKPHIGTDELVKIVINIRKEIEKLGGIYYFSNKLIDVKVDEENNLTHAVIEDMKNNNVYTIKTDNLILATGHSARDVFNMLNLKHVKMEKKPFAVGVRIENSQMDINLAQYGKNYYKLPPAEYKINVRTKNNRNVYTFCMCPGGVVVPSSSHKNMLVVNGMSYSKRDGKNANSALLVDVKPTDLEDDLMSGLRFQEELEKKAFILGGSNYFAPVQLAKDYVKNRTTTKINKVKPTYSVGYKLVNLNGLFPEFIEIALKDGLTKLNSKINNFYNSSTLLTAVETRSSSPLRIIRDENFNSTIKGLIPCGEGAGYAGGIMSAAVDGIKCAEKLFDNKIKK